MSISGITFLLCSELPAAEIYVALRLLGGKKRREKKYSEGIEHVKGADPLQKVIFYYSCLD